MPSMQREDPSINHLSPSRKVPLLGYHSFRPLTSYPSSGSPAESAGVHLPPSSGALSVEGVRSRTSPQVVRSRGPPSCAPADLA
ncbi:uncharacterized protein [Narcine bancroftii]|uniref:uncharacterized protein n=1 Tax=Narcine bancroftii TaxID=1343680 RepID=UPI0038316C24